MVYGPQEQRAKKRFEQQVSAQDGHVGEICHTA